MSKPPRKAIYWSMITILAWWLHRLIPSLVCLIILILGWSLVRYSLVIKLLNVTANLDSCQWTIKIFTPLKAALLSRQSNRYFSLSVLLSRETGLTKKYFGQSHQSVIKISDSAFSRASARFLKYISPSIMSLILFSFLIGAKELSTCLFNR